MKKLIAAIIVCFFIASAVQAQTAVKPNSDKQTQQTTVVKTQVKTCCGHDFVDANKDGFCDKCGMKEQAKVKSGEPATTTKSGCSTMKNAGTGCSKQCGAANKTGGSKSRSCCGK